MIKRNAYIFILAALFLAAAKGLNAVGFWKFAGLPQPHGYEVMGLLFLALLFVLQNFLFVPFLATVEEREEQTVGKRARAEKTQAEVEGLLVEYRNKIHDAHIRAIRERERIALAAEEEERQRLMNVKQESNSKFSAAQEKMRMDMVQTRSELESSVDPLAHELAARLLSSTGGSSAQPRRAEAVEFRKG